jgi:hypothetical protein
MPKLFGSRFLEVDVRFGAWDGEAGFSFRSHGAALGSLIMLALNPNRALDESGLFSKS